MAYDRPVPPCNWPPHRRPLPTCSRSGPLTRLRHILGLSSLLVIATAVAACAPVATDASSIGDEASSTNRLVIYSGRSENLIAPLIEQFAASSGIEIEVRYGGSSEMAATIMEEGQNSPADLFFGQDAGSLGALAKTGHLAPLPDELLNRVPANFRAEDGTWVGISGRARVLTYNTDLVSKADLPDDIWGLTGEEWRSRVGWAPTNGSFQAFVTALRMLEGEERARQWLEAMIANDVQSYPNNSSIVDATGAGEIAAGLVNHYYLYRFLAEQGDEFPARNHYFPEPNAGSIINVAGVGIVNTASNRKAAETFIDFLLSHDAQQYFSSETAEYALADHDVKAPEDLKSLDQIAAPDIDLGGLDDLQGSLDLLQSVGALD